MAGVSKVVLDDTVLIDLTSDTVNKDVLLQGYTAHAADGSIIHGEVIWTDSSFNDGEGILIPGYNDPTDPNYYEPTVYIKATSYGVKNGILSIVTGTRDQNNITVSHQQEL